MHCSSDFRTNSNGDTLMFDNYVNEERHGLLTESYELKDGLQPLKWQWKNGELIDILTTQVIYLDQQCEVIEKTKFLAILNTINLSVPSFESFSGHGVNYYHLLYFRESNYNWKKLDKIIKERLKLDKQKEKASK